MNVISGNHPLVYATTHRTYSSSWLAVSSDSKIPEEILGSVIDLAAEIVEVAVRITKAEAKFAAARSDEARLEEAKAIADEAGKLAAMAAAKVIELATQLAAELVENAAKVAAEVKQTDDRRLAGALRN